jgi:hypothetical protein
VRATVKSKVRKLVKPLKLLVVTIYKRPTNPPATAYWTRGNIFIFNLFRKGWTYSFSANLTNGSNESHTARKPQSGHVNYMRFFPSVVSRVQLTSETSFVSNISQTSAYAQYVAFEVLTEMVMKSSIFLGYNMV